jgi:hypothetical protein
MITDWNLTLAVTAGWIGNAGAGVIGVGALGTIGIQAEVNKNSEINNATTKNRESLSNFLHMGYLLISSTPIIQLLFSRNPHEPLDSQQQ